MARLTIAGRTAELVFDMASWEEMEERVGTLDEIDRIMSGKERLRHYREVAEIFAAEGARLGRGEAMPADWLRDNLHPAQVRLVITAIKAAIGEGMKMETARGEGEAFDPVLAELEKKGAQDG